MAIYLEDNLPVVKYHGLKTNKAVTMGSTLAVTGAITATGGVSGAVTGAVANENVTATNVITAAESGTTYFLNSGTEFVSTLPTPAAGLKYTFIVKAAPSGASYTVVTASSANVIYGSVEVNGAAVAGVTEDTITFADGAAAIGDWVTVVSDGTNWYVHGMGVAAGSITLTQAS